jgi:hypothetical protein
VPHFGRLATDTLGVTLPTFMGEHIESEFRTLPIFENSFQRGNEQNNSGLRAYAQARMPETVGHVRPFRKLGG